MTESSHATAFRAGRRILARCLNSRYIVSLGMGYAQMAVMIAVSLAQVPLFLFYLGKSQFGIWALATQVSIWMQLVDGGMTGALARNLIDYRNDKTGNELQKCLATGARVLCIQGFLVFAFASLLGFFGKSVFGLSSLDALTFQKVMAVLGISTGIGFAGKVAQSWLYSCQRLDLANLIGFILAPLEFALVWILLHQNVGIMSLAWARLSIAVLGVSITWWASVRWAAFPWRQLASGWDVGMFRRLVAFGGGMFMITIASLLLTATQTAMTTRYLGLTSAAVWATAPKVFMLAQQVVCKLWDYRVPYLSSLMSEERRAQLSKEYINLFGIIAYIAGATTGVLAAINPAFLELWTAGQIKWEPINNFLMAVFVYNYLIVRCFSDFVLHTKKIGWMPLLMCCEGVLFVLLASLLMPRYGLSGMLFAALIIGILQLPYSWRCFSAYLASDAPALSSLLKKVLGGACCGGILWGFLTLVSFCIPSHSLLLSLLLQSIVAITISTPMILKLIVSFKKAKLSL